MGETYLLLFSLHCKQQPFHQEKHCYELYSIEYLILLLSIPIYVFSNSDVGIIYIYN